MRGKLSLVTVLLVGALVVTKPAHAEGEHAHHAAPPAAAAAPSPLSAVVTVEGGALRPRQKNGIMLRLTHAADEGGFPLFWDELEPVHEQRIHLLIVDPSLSDYHHEHPVPFEKDGNYAFFIKPQTACSYKIWAQVHFKGGREETVKVTIPGAEDCGDKKPSRDEVTKQIVGDYTFTMTRDTEKMQKGRDTMLTLSITGKDGAPFDELEPVMGAFAHLVGFYEDYENIAHIHPLGEEPKSIHERGGPELKFHYRPDRAGLVKMFAQVKIGGKMVFAPLTFTVVE